MRYMGACEPRQHVIFPISLIPSRAVKLRRSFVVLSSATSGGVGFAGPIAAVAPCSGSEENPILKIHRVG